jgi:multicomponent Na+:H+ antiporter subunit G
MLEWILFAVCALLLFAAMVSFTGVVIGAIRFGFVMNCMHSAGIGDTFGTLCLILSLVLSIGPGFNTLKLLIILVFLWVNSPVSTHFLIQVEYFTNKELYRFSDRISGSKSKETDSGEGK